MKLVRIFEGQNPGEGLYSVHFEGEAMNEYEKCWKHWTDSEWVFKYFKDNERDLNSGFFNEKIAVSKASQLLWDESVEMFKNLRNLAKSTNPGKALSLAFTPLIDGFEPNDFLQKEKAKLSTVRKLIRLYAIKISPRTYVITGGGIKLVNRMSENAELTRELTKLEQVRLFLIEEGILDKDDLNSYEI